MFWVNYPFVPLSSSHPLKKHGKKSLEFLVFHRRKKVMRVWNNIRVIK